MTRFIFFLLTLIGSACVGDAAHHQRFQEARGSCPYPKQKCVLSELGKPICAPHPTWLDGLDNCIRFSDSHMPGSFSGPFMTAYSDHHDRFIIGGSTDRNNVLVSRDGRGAAWDSFVVNHVSGRIQPVAVPFSPRVIFFTARTTASDCGTFTDDFVTFTNITTCPSGFTSLLHNYYNSIYIAERNRIIISTGVNGIVISDDLGVTWSRVEAGTTFGLAYSPSLQIVVAGMSSAGGRLKYSEDYGDTWNAGNTSQLVAYHVPAWSPVTQTFAIYTNTKQCLYSYDGKFWSLSTFHGFTTADIDNIHIVRWMQSLQLFVAMTASTTATFIYSPDAINWYKHTTFGSGSTWYRGRWHTENTRTGAILAVHSAQSAHNYAVCNMGGPYIPCGVVAANDRSMCNKRAEVDDLFNNDTYVATTPTGAEVYKSGIYYIEFLDAWISMSPLTAVRPQISFNEMTSWTEIMTNYSMSLWTQYRPYSMIAMNEVQRIFAPVYGLTCGLMSYNGIDWWIVQGCATESSGAWWYEGVWMADRHRILLFEVMKPTSASSTKVPQIIYSDDLGGTWTDTGFANVFIGPTYRAGLLQTAVYEPSHRILVSAGNNGVPYYSTTFGVTWTEATRVSRVEWNPFTNPGVNSGAFTFHNTRRFTCAYSPTSRIFVCRGVLTSYSYDGKTFTSTAVTPSLYWNVWYTPVHDMFYGVERDIDIGEPFTSNNRVLQVSHNGIEWYSSQPRSFGGAAWFLNSGSSAVSTRTGRIAITSFEDYGTTYLVMVPRRRNACGPDESDWGICDDQRATCRGGYCVSAFKEDVIVPYTNSDVTRTTFTPPTNTQFRSYWIDERQQFATKHIEAASALPYWLRFNSTGHVAATETQIYDTAQTLAYNGMEYISSFGGYLQLFNNATATSLMRNPVFDKGTEILIHRPMPNSMTQNIHAEIGVAIKDAEYSRHMDITVFITTDNEIGSMPGHRGLATVWPKANYNNPTNYYFLAYSPTARVFIAGMFGTNTLFTADGINYHVESISFRSCACKEEWTRGMWDDYDCYLHTTTELWGYKRVGNTHTTTQLRTGLASSTTSSVILPRTGGALLRTGSASGTVAHILDPTDGWAPTEVTSQAWLQTNKPWVYDMDSGSVVFSSTSTAIAARPNTAFQARCRPVEETQFGHCDNGGLCDEESSTCTDPSCSMAYAGRRTIPTTDNCRGARRWYAYSDTDDILVISRGVGFQDPDVDSGNCSSGSIGLNLESPFQQTGFIPHLNTWTISTNQDTAEQITTDWNSAQTTELSFTWNYNSGPDITTLRSHGIKACSEHHGICVSNRGQNIASMSQSTTSDRVAMSHLWSRNGRVYNAPVSITATLGAIYTEQDIVVHNAVCYSPYLRRWVSIHHDSRGLQYSDDGQKWIQTTSSSADNFFAATSASGPTRRIMNIVWNPDKLEFAFYSGGILWLSRDGIAWGRIYNSGPAATISNYDLTPGVITWVRPAQAYIIGLIRHNATESGETQNVFSHVLITRDGLSTNAINITGGATPYRQVYGFVWMRGMRLLVMTSHNAGATFTGEQTSVTTFLRPTCPIEACKVKASRWTSTKSRCKIDITLDYARHDYLIEDEVLWAHTKRRLDVTCITGADVPDPMTTCGEAFGLRVPCVPGRIIKDRRIQYVNMTTSELWMCAGVTNTSTMPDCDSNACPIHGSRNVSMSLMSHLHSTHSYLTRTCNRTWDVDHSTMMSCTSTCSAPTTPTGFSTCSVDVHFGQWGRVIRTTCDTPTGESAWPSGCGTIFPNASVNCTAGQRAQKTLYNGDVYMPVWAECRGTTTTDWENGECTGPAGHMKGKRNATKITSYQRTFAHPNVKGQIPHRCTRVYRYENCTTSAPFDCQVSDWTSFSTCSHDCYGVSCRTRNITETAVNGGAACPATHECVTCNANKASCVASATTASTYNTPPTNGRTCTQRVVVVPTQISGVMYRRALAVCARHASTTMDEFSTCGAAEGTAVTCPLGGWNYTYKIALLIDNANPTLCTQQAWVSAITPPDPNPYSSVAFNSSITATGFHTCNGTCDSGGSGSSRTDFFTHNITGFEARHCQSLWNEQPCTVSTSECDCEVSDWGPWSNCTVACGGGTRWRARNITVGGYDCPTLNETEACNAQCCPVSCQLSEFSNWGGCNATCGGGIESRSRVVTAEAECNGTCGHLEEYRECAITPCPINCTVSEWSDWSECSAFCGNGTAERTRTIETTPQFGGTACPSLQEIDTCNDGDCDEFCEVGDFVQHSPCAPECGTRFRVMRAPVESVEPEAECPEYIEQLQACDTIPCPIDCLLSNFTFWTECNATCGTGYRTRERFIIVSPQFDGDECDELVETATCNTDPCGTACQLTEWTAWTQCSATCNGGTQTRTRSIEVPNVPPGAPCPTNLFESRACNTQPCDVDCIVSDWSIFTTGACYIPGHPETICGDDPGVWSQTRTVIQPVIGGGAPCPAELSRLVACVMPPCGLPPPPPGDAGCFPNCTTVNTTDSASDSGDSAESASSDEEDTEITKDTDSLPEKLAKGVNGLTVAMITIGVAVGVVAAMASIKMYRNAKIRKLERLNNAADREPYMSYGSAE